MLGLGRFDEVISLLKELAEDYNDINSKSLIHIRIASAYEKKGEFTNAVREYLNILKTER